VVAQVTPQELGESIRQALADEHYPESLSSEARSWIDEMYRAHGALYESRPEHAFADEFLRRCGLTNAEIMQALGALHP
jgi:hypothetical protein